MGAIDIADAIIESCNAARKSFRWFVKLGIHLMPKNFSERFFHLPGFVQAAAKEFYRFPEDDNKDHC